LLALSDPLKVVWRTWGSLRWSLITKNSVISFHNSLRRRLKSLICRVTYLFFSKHTSFTLNPVHDSLFSIINAPFTAHCFHNWLQSDFLTLLIRTVPLNSFLFLSGFMFLQTFIFWRGVVHDFSFCWRRVNNLLEFFWTKICCWILILLIKVNIKIICLSLRINSPVIDSYRRIFPLKRNNRKNLPWQKSELQWQCKSVMSKENTAWSGNATTNDVIGSKSVSVDRSGPINQNIPIWWLYAYRVRVASYLFLLYIKHSVTRNSNGNIVIMSSWEYFDLKIYLQSVSVVLRVLDRGLAYWDFTLVNAVKVFWVDLSNRVLWN